MSAPHSAQCGWHCDQYDWECDCGVSRPATPGWAEREVIAAEDAVRSAEHHLVAAKYRLASVDGRRMAETPQSGSVRSTTSAVPHEDAGDAQ